MGNLRKLERNAVKNKAIKDGVDFETAWSNYREQKYVAKDNEGNVVADRTPRSNQKKKQSHFDNKEQYFNMFNWMKNLRNKKNETDTVEA